MKVKAFTDFLESIAPRSLQESYDNCGLITGSPDQDVTGVLVTLDCVEAVVEEAIQNHCNLIIAHHPILFKGLKKLTGSNYVERTLLLAIRSNIAIYAIHTNLDNVHRGVNQKIAQKLHLKNTRILQPASGQLLKLVSFVPQAQTEPVLQALYQAGAGQVGHYKNCSFQTTGTGTFMPGEEANPYIGRPLIQESVQEARIEVILPRHLESTVLTALRKAHPYEEVAYYLSELRNVHQEIGAGMVGELEQPMSPAEFLRYLKKQMSVQVIRHTRLPTGSISQVAVCGGAGGFLLPKAIAAEAQAFVTADMKYHEFFDADGQILLADIGHYESEVFTKELLGEYLREKFPTFAVNFSTTNTNPISYLV